MTLSDRLSDLDDLRLRCRTERAREYIEEAISCYQGSSYRAAIVTIWIAIVFDLVDKVRELSIQGDGNAALIYKQFEDYQAQIEAGNTQGIKAALSFERDILNTVRNKLQFFDQQQFFDLERLREDRHRCAHPSFQKLEMPFRPTAELVRLHLRNAVYHVLEQAPVQGKQALDELQSLIYSKYFPLELTRAVAQLKSSSFATANTALVNGFIDLLIFEFFTAGSTLHQSNRVVSGLLAATEINRTDSLPRIIAQLNKTGKKATDSEFVAWTYLVLTNQEAVSGIESTLWDKVIQFIRVGPAIEVSYIALYAIKFPTLVNEVTTRINSFSIDEFTAAIFNLGALAVPRSIAIFTSAKSWIQANIYANSFVLPILQFYTRNDVEQVINAASSRELDLNGSHGFGEFIQRVTQLNLFTPQELDTLLEKNKLSQYCSSEA